MIKIERSTEWLRISRVALGDILSRGSRSFGGRPAVIDGETVLTHAELDALSCQFAHYLLDTFPRGIHVATLCANSAQMLAAINGIHKAGAVWVPVNIKLDVEQINYILRHAEVSCIIADEEICANQQMASMLSALGLPIVVTRVATEPSETVVTFSAALSGRPEYEPDVEISADMPALIMYTSGTTGNPKGVVHSHGAVYHAVISNVAVFGFNSTDVLTCMLPLFHCGQHAASVSALLAGACLVIRREFNPRTLILDIVENRVSVVLGLPMMYARALADATAETADFSSLRLCIYAMAPMSSELFLAIAHRMCPNLMLATGQTEIYPMTMSYHPTISVESEANYWGVSTPICETAIMDDEGNLLAPGNVGEIVHRGPSVMLGYFKDPEATEASRRFGWHHTGDIGMVDEDGQLHFLDRKKDMVKSGGENVSSVKVEAAILGHPSVESVAVIGVPHPHWSEAICAVVQLRAGMNCSEVELDVWCRERLGKFEVPKAIRFVDCLPLTSTGKIQKGILRKKLERIFLE